MPTRSLSTLALSMLILSTPIGSSTNAATHMGYDSPCKELKEGPVTIFIHGTTFPLISRLIGHQPGRQGLYRYGGNPRRLTARQHLAKSLYQGAPSLFPQENFYKFYWSGDLELAARKSAAQDLFKLLKNHTGHCTLIAHSHGCNVALHLAEIASQNSLDNLPARRIDKLVLLAPPVQEITAHLVHSPFFKRVYSCYSTADFIQIADPQGLRRDMKCAKKIPLFSQRTYKPGPHLTQAQITFHRHEPGHIEFIRPCFFRQLPDILKLLDAPDAKSMQHVRIAIPPQGQKPYLIEKKQEKRMMRIHYSSSKHRK